MFTDHAPLAPSAAFQWRYCAGSVIMQAMAAAMGDSDASIEGNAAHWAAAEILEGVDSDSLLGKTAPNGYVITKQILRYVGEFVDAVRALQKKHPDHETWIEYRVSIGSVHPDCWGTFDCAIYVPSLRLLYILDLKYGFGIVEAYDNEQLKLYGLGFIEELVTKRHRPVDQVKLGVVQPRAYHREGTVRIVDVTKQELSDFRAEMQIAARNALVPEALCQTGPKHCKNCEARAICPALRKATDNALDFIEQAQPEQLAPADLGQYLNLLRDYKKLINARFESLENQATEMINRGQPVLGHYVGPGRGSRDWNVTDAEVKALGAMYDIEMSKEKLLSPNQAETAGLDKKVVKAFVTNYPGKPKLQAGDPSELAERIFNK